MTQSAEPKKQSPLTSPAKKITSNVAKQIDSPEPRRNSSVASPSPAKKKKPKETPKAKRKVRHLGHCTSGL